MSKKVTKEGWGWPSNARKAHYFVDNRSLCGRWLFFGELENFNHESSFNCLACRRKHKKRSKSSKRSNRAFRKFQRVEQGYQGWSPLPPSYQRRKKKFKNLPEHSCENCGRLIPSPMRFCSSSCKRQFEEERRVEQCSWKCPLCQSQCGGVKGHRGEHQCSRHRLGGKET